MNELTPRIDHLYKLRCPIRELHAFVVCAKVASGALEASAQPSFRDHMAKKYLYISKAFPQLSLHEQEELFSSIRFDSIICEDHPTANRPHRAWNGLNLMLRNGDVLAVASLSVFSFKLPMLNRLLKKLISQGVTIKIGLPELTISPASSDPAFQLIEAYDIQMRHVTSRNIKKGLASSVRGGRPPQLTLENLPELKKLMADPSLTMNDICSKFGVSRSTIYNFVNKTKAS